MVKPHFTNSTYRESYYSTFDLKGRGWTVTMIRKLLPEHDAEKENHMAIPGSSGKRFIAHPVKLYDQERVKLLEDSEAFFELYERGQRALQRGEKRKATVLQRKQELIAVHLAAYQPDVHPARTYEENVRLFEPVLQTTVQTWWDAHIRGELLEGATQDLIERFQQAYLQATRALETHPKTKKRQKATPKKVS